MNRNGSNIARRLVIIALLMVAVAALLLYEYRDRLLPPPSAPTALAGVTPSSSPAATTTPPALLATATPTASPQPALTPSPVATPWRVAIHPDVPAPLQAAIAQALAPLSDRYQQVSDGAELVISLSAEAADATPFLTRVYVPVMRFATLRDSITTAELLALWQGTEAGTLYADAETHSVLQALWGAPGNAVTVVETPDIVSRLWQEPSALAIVPFDRLEPRLAALALDGQRATDNHLAVDATGAPADYGLTLRLYLSGPLAAQLPLLDVLLQAMRFTNRDPNRLTTLIMTGVTAMARMTAVRIEQYGDPAYPARVIGPVLAAADITHISNEIPFVADCVADGSLNNLVLCSHPSYFATFEMVGTDIIGLTGNHMADFGYAAMLYTLDLYDDKGLPYYGGGRNATEATTPLVITHNGNRIAFLGANQFGPAFTWATDTNPGAARYDPAFLTAQIRDLKQSGQVDIVAVEFQWEESYNVTPLLSQVEGFRAMAAAGADLVTGVQSHVPQTVEFYADGQGGVILYGLGNLFFDQMWSQETREGLIVRHTFHQGRHIATELLVTILEDYVQPRWATAAERAAVLTRVFAASGW